MKKQSYEYPKKLTLGEKTAFIMEVAEMVISEELGYIPILKDVMFDYCIAKYYGEEHLFEDDMFSLAVVEDFLNNNREILEQIKAIVGKDEIDALYNACEESIEFRKLHFAKPDSLSKLLTAVTEWVNSAATQSIDMDVINKFAEVIPMMKEMGSAEVAKAIIKNMEE